MIRVLRGKSPVVRRRFTLQDAIKEIKLKLLLDSRIVEIRTDSGHYRLSLSSSDADPIRSRVHFVGPDVEMDKVIDAAIETSLRRVIGPKAVILVKRYIATHVAT